MFEISLRTSTPKPDRCLCVRECRERRQAPVQVKEKQYLECEAIGARLTRLKLVLFVVCEALAVNGSSKTRASQLTRCYDYGAMAPRRKRATQDARNGTQTQIARNRVTQSIHSFTTVPDRARCLAAADGRGADRTGCSFAP